MRVWSFVCASVWAIALVAGCTLSKPDAPAPAGNPITGGEIAVTSLDAPAADAAPVKETGAKPVPEPAPEILPVPAAPEPRLMSPEEQLCAEKGGLWGAVGLAGAACMYPTNEAGKQCRKESDCDGYCLARSGTCAPYKPMFGCNEIVQDDGVVVTLCID